MGLVAALGADLEVAAPGEPVVQGLPLFDAKALIAEFTNRKVKPSRLIAASASRRLASVSADVVAACPDLEVFAQGVRRSLETLGASVLVGSSTGGRRARGPAWR